MTSVSMLWLGASQRARVRTSTAISRRNQRAATYPVYIRHRVQRVMTYVFFLNIVQVHPAGSHGIRNSVYPSVAGRRSAGGYEQLAAREQRNKQRTHADTRCRAPRPTTILRRVPQQESDNTARRGSAHRQELGLGLPHGLSRCDRVTAITLRQ